MRYLMVMTDLQENKEIILLGDLNCDYSKPTDNSCLKDITKINGLKQMITQPTRTTMTTSSLIRTSASRIVEFNLYSVQNMNIVIEIVKHFPYHINLREKAIHILVQYFN